MTRHETLTPDMGEERYADTMRQACTSDATVSLEYKTGASTDMKTYSVDNTDGCVFREGYFPTIGPNPD